MKKKILAVLLCICTLLPLLPVISFAEGVELNFERYFSGSESDWEIYNGTTSLVLTVSGDEAAKLASSVDSNAYTWYMKTNGETYNVNPESYVLTDNDSRIILRFPTFEHGFCPSINPIEQTGEDVIGTLSTAGLFYYHWH